MSAWLAKPWQRRLAVGLTVTVLMHLLTVWALPRLIMREGASAKFHKREKKTHTSGNSQKWNPKTVFDQVESSRSGMAGER